MGFAAQAVTAATQRRRESEDDGDAAADDRASRSLRSGDEEKKKDPASQVLAAVPAVAGLAQNFGVRMPVGVTVDDEGLHVGAKAPVGGAGEVSGQVDIGRDGTAKVGGHAELGAGPGKVTVDGDVTRDEEGKVAANGNIAGEIDAGPIKASAKGGVHRDAEGKTTAEYDAGVGYEGNGVKGGVNASGKRDADGKWKNDESASVEYENEELGVNAHAKGGLHHEDGKTTAEYDAGASYDKGGVKADVGATGAKDADGKWKNDESASVEYENEELGVNAHANGGLHHEDGKTTAEYDAGASYDKGGVKADVGATGAKDADGKWKNDESASVEYENEELGVNAHAKGGLHHEDGKTTAEYDAGASYDKGGVKADVAATGAKDKDGKWKNDERASVEYENEEAGVNAHAKGGLHHEDGKTTAEYDAGASYDKGGVKADVGATGAKDQDGAWTNDESASVEYEDEEAGVKASAKGALHHEDGKTTADGEAHGELKKGPLDVHADGEAHKSAEGEVTAKASGHAGLKHGDDHAEVDGHVERHADGKVDGEAKAAWNIKGHAGEKLLAGGGEHEGAEEEGVDLRGEHKPDVGQHAQVIDQLAGGDLEDEGAEHQADESESTAVNDNQLPEDLKDVGQVDSELAAKKAKVEAEGHAKQAKLEHKHDVAKHHAAADKKRQLAGQHGQHAAQAQKHSVVAAKQKKVATKDELRTKLTTAATTQKAKLEADVTAQKAKLDEKLAAEFTKLEECETKEQAKLQTELDKRTTKLEADIAKKQEAHTKQIAKERVDLDKKDATEQATLRAKAKADAEAIKVEADKQAAATAEHAKLKANDLSIKGMTEAGGATVDANRKAEQAINAANGRASGLAEDEAKKVRAEGESRAAMARAAGERKKADILAKAKADGDAIRTKGLADAEAQKKAGADRVTAALKAGEDQAAKVHAATITAIAGMQAKSDAAVAEMNAEVAKMKADVAAKQAEITAKAATRRTELKAKAEAEKTRALTQIEKEYQDALKTIDTKVAADLAKIDAASDKDLANLERQVDQDIAKIEAAVKRAEQRIDQQVKAAERKVHAQCLAEKAKIHADTCNVIGGLDRMAFQAKQRIAAADKDTKNEIHAAHAQGVAEVEAASQQAAQDLQQGNEALLKATEDQGAADRAAADKAAADSGKAMEGQRADLDKEINKEWVDDATQKANAKLDDTGVFNVVTDGEATDAMNILNSLPADLQGDAVEQLDKDAFANLLDEVPEKRRAEFDTMVADTHDPERKLKLWGEQHKSQADKDAEAEHKKTADEGGWDFWNDTKEQDRNERLNSRRDDIIDSTKDETDEEVKFLLEKQKAGTLTEADVDALRQRKEHEHKIEMKYNVNLTNDTGLNSDKKSKIGWNDGDLSQIEAALAVMPEEHVKDNTMLKEIRRAGAHPKQPNVGGDHSDGVIKVYEPGTTFNYRHNGDALEGQDPNGVDVNGNPLPKNGDPLGSLHEVINHEFGHDIHDQNEDAFKRYQDAAGWESDVGKKQLGKAGLTDDQIEQLKETDKDKPQLDRIEGKDGKIYVRDPYNSGEVLAYDKGAIPEAGNDALGNALPGMSQPNNRGWDTWNYANTNYKDHFAEHYMKALDKPETLAKDLIDAPTQRVTGVTTKRDQAQGVVDAAKAKTPPDPAAVTQAEADLQKAQAEVDDAVKDQTAQKKQYDIMRDEIFHADKAATDAEARLKARGVDQAKIDDFNAKAARLQTPKQIESLEAQY
ncbi:MAG: hypothetical protein IPH80_20190 [Myxococcales bacterium]|nr:hypothetical protein [Myxococcales bacterium]